MSNFIKKAYAVSMNYEITDAEKMQAEKALLLFNQASKQVNEASDSLNLLNNPFKDNPDMKPDDVFEKRFFLRKFRDDTISKFKTFEQTASQCVSVMSTFESDPQTIKMLKSLNSCINDLGTIFVKFKTIFADLKSATFSKDVVESITSLQDKATEIKSLIDDRIKMHIETDILNKNWNSGPEYIQHQVEKKSPLVMELYEERQKALDNQRKE